MTPFMQVRAIEADIKTIAHRSANTEKALAMIDNADERQMSSPKFWNNVEKKLTPSENRQDSWYRWGAALRRSVARREGAANEIGLHRDEFAPKEAD